MGSEATRKTKTIRNRFAGRPPWHVHVTPTSALWLNQVERVFTDLTIKQVRRGVHHSTVELERSTTAYIETVIEDPGPFRWQERADDILASIHRFCCRTLETTVATDT